MSDKRTVQDLLNDIEGLGDGFDPSPAIELLRRRAGDQRHPDHVIADMIEGMWDEIQLLRKLLDESKGPKPIPKSKREK